MTVLAETWAGPQIITRGRELTAVTIHIKVNQHG
jgi:hypothetical protein